MMHELIRYAARPVYKVLRREAPKRFFDSFRNHFFKNEWKNDIKNSFLVFNQSTLFYVQFSLCTCFIEEVGKNAYYIAKYEKSMLHVY